jgi:hypothetical protein
MRVAFNRSLSEITVYREAGDRKFYGRGHASGENRLLYHLAKHLNAMGFRLIRVCPGRDGHMLGDEYQRYLRPPVGCPRKFPHIYIYSGFYAIRGANENYNKEGKVTLIVTLNCLEKQSNCASLVRKLMEKGAAHAKPHS